MSKFAIEARDIVAGYVPELPILKDVSLKAETAKVTVIIGPNGAGKSTLIKAIAGLVKVSSGRVTLNGSDITNPQPDQMGAMGIAYVPQSNNIFRSLTIRQNLELLLRNAGAERAARLAALFEQFPPLAEKQHQKAGALSGGQRQFLAVAMALAVKPSVILMDEPSAGLSPKAAQEVLEHARKLTEQGVTIILVEQNVKQALRLADHCYILADGRNQVDGPAQDLLSDPVVAQIYLGGKRIAATAAATTTAATATTS
ncbi:MAG: ABC transporter ATP-binding protein [Rhizobiaceae bacterium]